MRTGFSLGLARGDLSCRHTAPPRPIASGVLFDSDGGNTFADLLFTPDPRLTVSPGGLAFDNTGSSADAGIRLFVADSGGNQLQIGFDTFEIDATFRITSAPFAGQPIVKVGHASDLGIYGARVQTFSGGADYLVLSNTNGANQSRADVAGVRDARSHDYQLRVRYIRDGAEATALFTENGAELPGASYRQVPLATADETPRGLMRPLLRASGGAWQCSRLRVAASFPNAPLGVLGDSLSTQHVVSTYARAWPQLLRASRGHPILVSGAPGKLADGFPLQGFIDMRPRRALIELGVNDFASGRSAAQVEAALGALATALEAEGIEPVFLNCPPLGNGGVRPCNAWLAAQRWRVIDIFSALVDPATLGGNGILRADLSAGDSVPHWNDAGHQVVHDTVAAALADWGI